MTEKICEKCSCTTCKGDGWVGQIPCWACEKQPHTCLVHWLGRQMKRPKPASLVPFSPSELIELAEFYGKTGEVPLTISRLLATCNQLQDQVDFLFLQVKNKSAA
mgnify:FL=1